MFFDPSVKFYVKVINIILFYKLKEGALKKGEWTVAVVRCEVSVGGNS